MRMVKSLLTVICVSLGMLLMTSLSQAQMVPTPDLKIQLIAKDATTHSKVTAATTAIEVDALITNLSSNAYGAILVTLSKTNTNQNSALYITNRPSNAFVDLYTGSVSQAGYDPNPPFSSHLYYIIGTGQKLTLTNVKKTEPIVLHADLQIKVFDPSGAVYSTIKTQVEDVIFQP